MEKLQWNSNNKKNTLEQSKNEKSSTLPGWITINEIRLREPLEIQTVQPKKYLKWNELFIQINYLYKLIIYIN